MVFLLNQPLALDPTEMTQTCREVIVQPFFDVDVGMLKFVYLQRVMKICSVLEVVAEQLASEGFMILSAKHSGPSTAVH